MILKTTLFWTHGSAQSHDDAAAYIITMATSGNPYTAFANYST